MCGWLDPRSCCLFQFFFRPQCCRGDLPKPSQSPPPHTSPSGNFLLSQFDWARSTGRPFPVLPVCSLHERRPTVENLNWDHETKRPQWAVPDSAQMWTLLDHRCVFRLVACHRLRRELGHMSANLLRQVSANTPAKRDVPGVITSSEPGQSWFGTSFLNSVYIFIWMARFRSGYNRLNDSLSNSDCSLTLSNKEGAQQKAVKKKKKIQLFQPGFF